MSSYKKSKSGKPISAEKVFKRWHKDPVYVEAFDRLDAEFTHAAAMASAPAGDRDWNDLEDEV